MCVVIARNGADIRRSSLKTRGRTSTYQLASQGSYSTVKGDVGRKEAGLRMSYSLQFEFMFM